MPLSRFERLPSDRQERVLAAAAREFAAAGYESASLGRIAEGAGISKPALYYYFQDKADLYASAIRAAWLRLRPAEGIDLPALTAETFWPSLARLQASNLASLQRDSWLIAVWKLAYRPPPPGEPASAVQQVFAEGRAFLEALLRRGQELQVVRTDLPGDLMIALLTGLDAAADHWIAENWERLGQAEVDRIAGLLFETLQRLLMPPQARES